VIVSDIRFLGVHVDSYFSYNLHVDTLELKLRQGSYLMKKLVNYCDLPTVRSVYLSYFQSKLVYCLSSWGFISAGNITKIFRIQKKIVRIMAKVPVLTSCRSIFIDYMRL